ncbi:hypothetical protein GCM10027404_10860 [Arthrobacter tumbae]
MSRIRIRLSPGLQGNLRPSRNPLRPLIRFLVRHPTIPVCHRSPVPDPHPTGRFRNRGRRYPRCLDYRLMSFLIVATITSA